MHFTTHQVYVFIFAIVYFEHVFSLRPQKLRNSLSDNLKKYNKEDVYNKKILKPTNNERRIKIGKEFGKKYFGRSKLVSRIIPHGYQGSSYEYDGYLNTLYKPLIRFHLKKPAEKIVENETKSKLLGYVFVLNKKKHNQNGGNKQIKKGSKSINAANAVVDGVNLGRYLRSKAKGQGSHAKALLALIDKSTEDHDELHPSNIPYIDSSPEVTEPSIIIPMYPFWNYWTYKKTIHQDDCPGNLVKLGNMCIQTPGHRKQNA